MRKTFAILALSLLGCGGRWISMRDAYYRDMVGCELRNQDEDDVRGCKHLVSLRYERYWSNGQYPNMQRIPRFER